MAVNVRARCIASFALVPCLAWACTREPESRDPPPVQRRVDIDRIPVPNHGPAVMQLGGGGGTHYAGTPGAIQAEFFHGPSGPDDLHGPPGPEGDGVTRHFEFMPKGGNVASHVAAREASRIEITGLARAGARESLSLRIEGVRLDAAALPLTLVAGQPGVVFEIRYETADDTWWKIDPADPHVSDNRITLEHYEGARVAGTFEGRLRPRSPAQGGELRIMRGSFAADLRLVGVKPGPKAAAP